MANEKNVAKKKTNYIKHLITRLIVIDITRC